mmetsp:Transcript_76131/g.191639  ORF Transcript_76131/g.191639 Transcript_76131/m.191639 type:complete len:208 (-) Transcript_76131:51-674(-)
MADTHPDIRKHPREGGRPRPEETLPHPETCRRPCSATLRRRFRATEDLEMTASHLKVFTLTMYLQVITLDLYTIAGQRHNKVEGRDVMRMDDAKHIVRGDADEATESLQAAPVGRIDSCRRRLHVDLDPFAEVLLRGYELSKVVAQGANITLIDQAAGNFLPVRSWLVRRRHGSAELCARWGLRARTCDERRHGVVGGSAVLRKSGQ